MNTLVFVASKYNEKSTESNYITEDGSIELKSTQTNETAAKLFDKILSEKKQKIDKVVMIVTEEVSKNLDLSKLSIFDENYDKINIISVPMKDKPDTDEIFRAAAETVSKLNADDEIYVDITGGFRDAVMLLVAIMRAVKVRGIDIKDIRYVNYKKDEKSIIYDRLQTYRIFDLISGIDEFISYGRNDKITEYYSDCNNSQITKVLEKMSAVSKALSLCQAKNIDRQFSNLFVELNNAKSEVDNKVFMLMINIIIENYQKYFGENLDRVSVIEVIKYCTDKNMILPSLAFFVENIPSFLDKKEMARMTADMKATIQENKRNNKKDYIDDAVYFFRAYAMQWDLSGLPGNQKKLTFDDISKNTKKPKELKPILDFYKDLNSLRNDIFHGKEVYKSMEVIQSYLIKAINYIEKIC